MSQLKDGRRRELTLLKAFARAIADNGYCPLIVTSAAMADQVKLPIIELSTSPAKGAVGVSHDNPADQRWILDVLEDDEVREARKSSAAVTPCATGGRVTHD